VYSAVLYRTIRTAVDQSALQEDLKRLEQWCVKWGMRLNSSKCEVMSINRRRTRLFHSYTIGDDVLKEVKKAKYLGLTITDNLSWSTHTAIVAGKANAKIGFLWRNLRHCPQKLKEQAYFALVRFIVEYIAAVWDPHLQKDKQQLERVHRHAARFVTGDTAWTSSVTSMLKDLG